MSYKKTIPMAHFYQIISQSIAKDLVYKMGAILRYLSGGVLRFGL